MSYYEIDSMLASEKGVRAEFETVVDNCVSLGINTLYLHVRAFCDSLYPSRYFPLMEGAKAYDFDIFEFMLDRCREAGISVHAWINPFRVRPADTQVDLLSKESPVYRWYHDENEENDENALRYEGIYLNPASQEARKLIMDGIREILTRYQVDGIHFDDYFYPTTDERLDEKSYRNYCQSAIEPLELADWRRFHVNTLIEGCHTLIHHDWPDCVFSVSPAASMEKNYIDLYADVEKWIQDGMIDCVIPQLYFGFSYPDASFQFEKLLEEWKKAVLPFPDVKMQIGLACYKINTDNPADYEEWHAREDVVARQADICEKDEAIAGYALFSYESLFSKEERNTSQRENLKAVIQSGRQ